MPTVDCKLIDCSKHGRTICISRERITIDGVGQVQCYDPVPRSNVVHDPVQPGHKKHGRWTENRNKGFR